MRTQKMVILLTAGAFVWGGFAPFVPLSAKVAEARAETSALQMMWQTPIGEGATLLKYTKSFAEQTVEVMVTKVDLNNPYVEVKPIYGTNGRLTERQTITQMAREAGAVAAINADFFNMSKRGAPFGIVMKDGQLISSMGLISYWYSLGITGDKRVLVEKFGFTGKVTSAATGSAYPLQGINKEEYNPSEGRKSHQNQLNMYTPAFGQTSLGAIPGYKDVVEVLFVDNVAKEVRVNQPGFYIPYNGYVLWGHGTAAEYLKKNFPVGAIAKVEYQTTPLNEEWTQAVGGNVLLVDQGRPLTSFQADKSITSLNARTAVGVSQDGKTLYMVTVTGTGNKGVYLDELARIMAEMGSWRAVNFDGGGSTTMSARMLGETQANLAIRPTGGSERRVPTGLAVFNTAPAGELRGFQIDVPAELLIGQKVTLSAVKGYDTHYQPYAVNSSQIAWEAQGGAGTVEGHTFTPTRSGPITITARAGNVTQSKQIQVLSGADVEQILVTPNPITIAPGQVLDLDIKLKTRKGTTVTAFPASVTASVNSSVAHVNDKLQLVAGDQPGSGTLTVSYDGVTTSVPFAVGQFEQPWLTFDNQSGMYHAAIPSAINSSGSFTAVSDPVFRTRKAGKLVYNFSGAPGSEMRIAYGVLGPKPVTIPGKPLGLGLWVYGDGSGHWLRAEVIDANGKPVYVDLAREIDWTGWKQVKGYFPGGVAYPLQLKSIYVVDLPNDPISHDKGTLYFDEFSLLLPNQNGPHDALVLPDQPGSMSLGSELDLKFSFARTAPFLESAKIEVESIVDQQLPGYVPADYYFVIKPGALKPGAEDQIVTSPIRLKLVPKNWIAGKGVGLLYANEATGTLDALPGVKNAEGEWVYEVNAYGTYIPYYLDQAGGETSFKDIANHPARAEIAYMANKGYVKGMTETMFGPELPLTRAQFVALLARTFEWELPASPKLPFRDNIPEYARGAIQAAVANGLVKGYEDNTFRPDRPVTRAEAAVILDRLLAKQANAPALADQKSWPSWAAQSISNMVGLGLVDPISGTYQPDKAMTRAACVVALYRILEHNP